ncbi:tRNA pseudouridine(38-40) synthase TruA [Alphaproteobacteria bacterium]|nr:tRNA pseudouridine(38-40) synthase TruA [Alphaproteobacteria bacterium]
MIERRTLSSPVEEVLYRFKLTIEYRGTAFYGWQVQAGDSPTVQRILMMALTALGENVSLVYGAGRTDSGVHALGQVAHVDLKRPWEPSRLREGMNAYLRDKDVAIIDCELVPADFHARFSAVCRHYIYQMVNRPSLLALDKERAWHVRGSLDVDAMKEAAACFVGKYDFSFFRARACQSDSPIKTIRDAGFFQRGERLFFHVSSRSFLHHQVRFMVGALKAIGEGVCDLEMLRQALDKDYLAQQQKITSLAPVAPAHGLYLTQVDYAPDVKHELGWF